MLLSEEDIKAYQRDGAVLLKGVLTEQEVALLAAGLEESRHHPGKRATHATSPTGDGVTFLETFPSLASGSLSALLESSRIPEIAARMMRASSSQLILDQVFYKEAGSIIPTPWHQDTPFLRVRGDDMIRVWVTPDFSPKEISLQIVRGSHRWGVVFDPRPPAAEASQIKETQGRFVQVGAGGGPAVPDINRYRESFDILNWDVAPGDALIFNGNMLHAAGGAENHSTPRRAYTSMWGGPQLQYITPPDNALPTLAQINKVDVPFDVAIGPYTEAFPVGWREADA